MSPFDRVQASQKVMQISLRGQFGAVSSLTSRSDSSLSYLSSKFTWGPCSAAKTPLRSLAPP
ncbi:hypothetical protein ES707_01658 [subsurface metagenome]|jgi:hypothetical protein